MHSGHMDMNAVPLYLFAIGYNCLWANCVNLTQRAECRAVPTGNGCPKIMDFIWIFWIQLLDYRGPALSSAYYEDIQHLNKWENLILINPMVSKPV